MRTRNSSSGVLGSWDAIHWPRRSSKQAIPYHVVEGVGADHLVFREQTLSLGAAAASIQHPFALPHLLDHIGDERLAGVGLAGLAAARSGGLTDRFPPLWGVAKGFPLLLLRGGVPRSDSFIMGLIAGVFLKIKGRKKQLDDLLTTGLKLQ